MPTDKKQTVIQELIGIVEMDYENGVEISMKVFHKMLTKALKLEKKQIIDTHFNGQLIGMIYDESSASKSEDYYNQTFNQIS